MKKQVNTLWGTAFAEQPGASLIRFTSGRDVAPVPPADQALVPYDLWVNTAHTVMLAKTGIISPADAVMLLRGLATLEEEVNAGKFTLDPRAEDVHTAIEFWLTRQVGPEVAGKIHTARSRNDQVVTDMRLFLRDQVINLVCNGLILLETLIGLADTHKSVPIPGFTHHQHAMVTTLGHVFAAMASMISRDLKRLETWYELHNVSPLGNAASFGTSFAIDRTMTAKLLGFDGPDNNSLDAITNRWEPEGDLIYAQSVLMNHCSALAETLILFSMPELRFVTLADSFCTGSSMMPQKKNPDPLEVVKGKASLLHGLLLSDLSVGKSAFIGYNRDSQITKSVVMDAVRECIDVPVVLAGLLASIVVDSKTMKTWSGRGFVGATVMMEQLACQYGLPMRKAKQIIERAVKMSGNCDYVPYPAMKQALAEMGVEVPINAGDVVAMQTPQFALAAMKSYGSPGKQSMKAAGSHIRTQYKEHARWVVRKLQDKNHAKQLVVKAVDGLLKGGE